MGSGGPTSAFGSAGIGSKDRRQGKLEHDVSVRAGVRLSARLKLHAKHPMLRKVSTALWVRIVSIIDKLGPFIVIDDVTSLEILIIAQMFDY